MKDNTYKEDYNKILHNCPLVVFKLKLPEFEGLVHSHSINYETILECKTKHVEGQVPMCDNISREDARLFVELFAVFAPSWECNSCQSYNCETSANPGLCHSIIVSYR
jgi:hypothetical protein